MSFYAQNLKAFIQLLQKKSQLFTVENRQELITLIEPLPDDVETLSVAIASWYENHDEIVDAQLEILNNSILIANESETQSTSAAAIARFSPNKTNESPQSNQPLNKETLKKAIQPNLNDAKE